MAGELNVDALLRRITAKQFREWQAYYALEPFDEQRGDYRSAQICQMLANIYRGANQKPFDNLDDFMLKFDAEPKKGQSVQEKLNVMTVIARAWNQVITEGMAANAAAAQATAAAHGVTLES